jgi:hypothetical protein
MNNYSQMPSASVEPQFGVWAHQLNSNQTTNLFFLKNTGLLPRLLQFRDYYNSKNKKPLELIDLDAENVSSNFDLKEMLAKLNTHAVVIARSRFLTPDSQILEAVVEHYHTHSSNRLILVHECAPHELYTTFDRASFLYVSPIVYRLPTDRNHLISYATDVVKLWKMKLTVRQIDACVNYCGNIAWLINEYIRIQAEYPDYNQAQIIEQPSLKYRVKTAYDSLPSKYRDALQKSDADPRIIKEMYNFGLIDATSTPIGQHLKDSISTSSKELLQTTTNKLIFNNVDYSSYFSSGELRLINLFNVSELAISREDVGNCLYQSDNADYSDWALAQSISRLRNKLNKHAIPLLITPVRGVGYVAKRNN